MKYLKLLDCFGCHRSTVTPKKTPYPHNYNSHAFNYNITHNVLKSLPYQCKMCNMCSAFIVGYNSSETALCCIDTL